GVITTQSETVSQRQSGNVSRRRRQFWELIPAFFGLIWLIIAFYPILYMLMTSLRSLASFFTSPSWLPPAQPTLANYQDVLANDFGLYFVNTVFVTVISVGLTVLVSLFASYAITRVRNRYTQTVFNLFLLGLAIPLQATIIPIYVMISDMHLY